MELNELANAWVDAKSAEAEATAKRRKIEDELLSLIGLPETFVGTQTIGDVFEIKVTGRMNHTIDADKLQEIAMENGTSDHLSQLFRWKPEINARAFSACDESILRPLREAITSKPGRPSFQIKKKEQE